MSQKLSLSTHILDISVGKPASNVPVKLFKLENNDWRESYTYLTTDNDGRIRDFVKVNDEVHGTYKLKFVVSGYFESRGLESLYPFIEVSLLRMIYVDCSFVLAHDKVQIFNFQIVFKITSNEHYHIPLLLSPYGYSTYRGS
jgi:5-hydroxyisourate hydrolase